mgnify:CR=1 FL=1
MHLYKIVLTDILLNLFQYFINFYALTKKQEPLVPFGHIAASEQFKIQNKNNKIDGRKRDIVTW